jgi:16S rRNA A1518/A1519 N6-dimethyltransferase RsmA/KsgA/DIM1 with predicted DNA glycosylase/AP lyase activity
MGDRSFWVLYGQHHTPTLLEDAGDGQSAQRNSALQYVTQWRNCLDIGSNIGQWTRPLAKLFDKIYCFEPNPNFRECFNKNILNVRAT